MNSNPPLFMKKVVFIVLIGWAGSSVALSENREPDRVIPITALEKAKVRNWQCDYCHKIKRRKYKPWNFVCPESEFHYWRAM